MVVPQGAVVLVVVQVVPVVLVFQEFLGFQVHQVLLAVQAFQAVQASLVSPVLRGLQVLQDPVVLAVLAPAVLAAARAVEVARAVPGLLAHVPWIEGQDGEQHLNRKTVHALIAKFALLRFALLMKTVRC